MADTASPTRFLILSDTHSITPAFSSNIPEVDVVLHCGDLTEQGAEKEHRNTRALLCKLKAELKLVIAGNHDLTLDKEVCTRFGVMPLCERVHEIWTDEYAKSQGIRYLTEGTHTFELSSGVTFTVYASPYTPRYGGEWAFQYPSKMDRWDPQKAADSQAIPNNEVVDIVMTHGPPALILDRAKNGSGGCEHLLRSIRRTRPLLHCFGHIHESFGAQVVDWQDDKEKTNEDGFEAHPKDWVGPNQMMRSGFLKKDGGGLTRREQTLFVNAAILDEHHKPTRVPWIVDLQLGGEA